METRDLTEEGFRPRRGGVCRETNPRANMGHSLGLVTTRQWYFVVLERFCAEKVTGGDYLRRGRRRDRRDRKDQRRNRQRVEVPYRTSRILRCGKIPGLYLVSFDEIISLRIA